MANMKKKSHHLIRNLERISPEKSIFNKKYGKKALLLLGQGNLHEWLDKLLPNTRIIIEPKIIGSRIAILYVNGKLKSAINKNGVDIKKIVDSLENIPKCLPIKKRIEIQGILYKKKYEIKNNIGSNFFESINSTQNHKNFRFCAFQIFHCNINHFQSLKELSSLNFEIPQTEYTKYISDIEIYLQCWKDGKLFKRYPTNGMVLKINSRKLQKQLGENNLSINWAYSIH